MQAAALGGGRVTVMGHDVILVRTGTDLGRLEPMLAKVRELAWEGEMEIDITDHSKRDRGASIELSSTATGEGTVVSTRPEGLVDEQRLVDAWRNTAG